MAATGDGISSLIWRAFRLLRREELRRAGALLGLMTISGLIETVVVASVVPLVIVLIDPHRLSAMPLLGPFAAWLSAPGAFIGLMTGVVVLLAGSTALNVFTLWLIERFGIRCKLRLARELLDQLVAAPITWLALRNTTVLSRQIFHDLNYWRTDYIQGVLTVVQSAIVSGLPLFVVLLLAPRAGLAVLAATALTAGATLVFFRKRMATAATQHKNAAIRTLQRLMEVLGGMREVKMSGNPGYFTSLYVADLHVADRMATYSKIWSLIPTTVVLFVGQGGFVATAIVFWAMDVSPVEIASALGMLAVIVARVTPSINRSVALLGSLSRTAPFVEDLLQLMSELRAVEGGQDRSAKTAAVPTKWGRVALVNVGYTFPGAETPALKGVTIEFARGGFYGIVGRSGSGKSTLANLLVGLLSPETGRVTVDGVPLAQYQQSDWCKRIGLVPQSPYLLDGTVEENVRFGSAAAADQGRLNQALDLALVNEIGDGRTQVSTLSVGEDGQLISGGQAQRIALARAIYRRCDLLVLDEATSALDTITERRIFENIKKLLPQPTIVAIAHRVSSLRQCDRIFVIEQGRLVADGTWDTLLLSSPQFRALVDASEESEAA